MITVIKTARVAKVAFPLHGHKRTGRQPLAHSSHAAAPARANETPGSDGHGAASGRGGQALSQARSDAASDPVSDQLADELIESVSDRRSSTMPPAVPATYAEGYEDGHAEGLREGTRKGHEEGWAEGLEQGRREAGESADAQERRARALADAVAAASALWEAELEAGAIEIAHAALLRIVGEAAGNRDAIVAMVRKVMEQLPERRALSIHLSPSDHALLEAESAHLPLAGATLVADERVELGGCIVDTDAGSLDARLETQLAGLRDLLLSLHRSGGEPQ